MPLKLVPPNPARRSPNYRIRGTHLGVRVDRSSGFSEQRKAQAILIRIKAEIESGALAPAPRVPTARGLASAVTSYIQAGGEARFLTPILEHFGPGASVEIDQAMADAAAAAIYPKATPATRNRQFFTPLLAVLAHAGIPTALKRPIGASGRPRQIWLRPEQFEALVKTAQEIDPEMAVLFTLLCYTGLRISEALRLRGSDIDLKAATAFSSETKNGDPRAIHLPRRVLAALKAHPRTLDSGRVFRWTKCGPFYVAARAIFKAAKIDYRGAPFHIFRHTYATWMTKIGADIVEAGVWRSHNAARVYQHFVSNEEAKKADALPGANLGKKRAQNAKTLK